MTYLWLIGGVILGFVIGKLLNRSKICGTLHINELECMHLELYRGTQDIHGQNVVIFRVNDNSHL